jgi:hypothetical protein
MATTPTAPVSAPAAVSAPSAPSSSPASTPPVSAPVSAPVAVPPAAVPAIVEAPGAAAPVVEAPAAAAPVATPVTKGPEPKQSDFPGDIEAFLDAHHKWDSEEGEAPAAEVPAVESPETKAESKETKPEAEKKDEVEPVELAEPEAVTPEVVSKWLDKDPALKAAIEASPEVKRQIFAMARINAKLKPMGEIFPTVKSAEFANEKSNAYVTMRSGFTNAIDNPETFPQAFEQFSHEFMVVDKDGNPVKDAAGNQTFGKDYDMLMQHVVNSNLDSTIAAVEALVKVSDDDNDNVYLSALKFVKDEGEKRSKGPQPPDPESLTPAQRAWQEQKEAELRARGEKLQGDEKKQTVAEKKAERLAYTKQVNRKIGGAIGKRLDAFMAEKAAENVFLPSYVTDVKNDQGQSSFAIQIANEFNAKVHGVALIRDHLEMLERLPPSPDNEKQRVDYTLQLIDDFMPDIMDKHLRQIQRSDIADRTKRTGNFEKRKDVAQAEPLGGSPVAVQAFTDQTAMEQAQKTVDKNYPNIDRAERVERTLIEKNRIMAGRSR